MTDVITTLLPLLFIVLVFWLLIIRPQMKRNKENETAPADFKPTGASLQKPPLVVVASAGAAIFLLAAIVFQPFSFRIPFGGEVQGWVFTLSQYPWPADHISAISFQYARWPFWGGQVFVGLVVAAVAEKVESRYRHD